MGGGGFNYKQIYPINEKYIYRILGTLANYLRQM